MMIRCSDEKRVGVLADLVEHLAVIGETWSLLASPPFPSNHFFTTAWRLSSTSTMPTSSSLAVFLRCSIARPPQPIWTMRTLSPALAAFRMLKGAAEITPAASAERFTNERRDRLFFTAHQWLIGMCLMRR